MLKAVTSVRSPKMKRDASVKVVFFLSKKTTFTEASLFIFGQRTDVTPLECYTIWLQNFDVVIACQR